LIRNRFLRRYVRNILLFYWSFMKTKRSIKSFFFYLDVSAQLRGIWIATFWRNVLSSIKSVKHLKIWYHRNVGFEFLNVIYQTYKCSVCLSEILKKIARYFIFVSDCRWSPQHQQTACGQTVSFTFIALFQQWREEDCY
jgi:hypothetical protein